MSEVSIIDPKSFMTFERIGARLELPHRKDEQNSGLDLFAVSSLEELRTQLESRKKLSNALQRARYQSPAYKRFK